ncbi:MAG: hypothetical protein QXN16_03110 [Candidatus Micrarchaeaceae archaeon]
MSVLDGISIAIVACLFILFFLNGAIIVSNVGNSFIANNDITPQMATYGVFTSAINTIYSADTLFVLLYFGLWMMAILAAAFIESEAINLPLTIFIGIIVIFVSFVISNVMRSVLSSPIYASVIQHFAYTQLLLANLGAITALFIFVYAIVILARPLYSGGVPGGGTRTSVWVEP